MGNQSHGLECSRCSIKRVPSLLQTKDVIKEKETLKILSLEKGSIASYMTSIFIVKEQ